VGRDAAVAEGGEDAGYFVSDDSSFLFLLADPVGGVGASR